MVVKLGPRRTKQSAFPQPIDWILRILNPSLSGGARPLQVYWVWSRCAVRKWLRAPAWTEATRAA